MFMAENMFPYQSDRLQYPTCIAVMTGHLVKESLWVFSIHQAFGYLHKRRFMRKDGELWLKIMPLHLPHIQLT